MKGLALVHGRLGTAEAQIDHLSVTQPLCKLQDNGMLACCQAGVAFKGAAGHKGLQNVSVN